jgi:hypothetical protein
MEYWSTYTQVYAHELNLTRMWTAKAVAYKCAASLLASGVAAATAYPMGRPTGPQIQPAQQQFTWTCRLGARNNTKTKKKQTTRSHTRRFGSCSRSPGVPHATALSADHRHRLCRSTAEGSCVPLSQFSGRGGQARASAHRLQQQIC